MTSQVTRNRVKFELLPLVEKYLDEHPDLVRQYRRSADPKTDSTAGLGSAAEPVSDGASKKVGLPAQEPGSSVTSALEETPGPAADMTERVELDGIELDDSDLELDQVMDHALVKIESQLKEQTAAELDEYFKDAEGDAGSKNQELFERDLVVSPEMPR
ncbi:hypothetical protein [Actinocatenispora sera]|uniref:Uncharacterized protein n=1 Tax=Actinocatenispora sera TaxID=390989 RepID=A0A810L9H2_9ACTN|nr:hypothetical protein [Actinocatenispora sera]BCJ31909.1 hypothetical protein Asera_60170 [Actinocatenispora sera]